MLIPPFQADLINRLSGEAVNPAGPNAARSGINAETIVPMSEYTKAALKQQASFCDTSAVAMKMSLPRFTWLGIPLTSFVAGVTPTQVFPNQGSGIPLPGIFAGTSLRLPHDSVATIFNLNGIFVGNLNQLLAGPVPGETFSNLSLAGNLDMDLATSGKPITLSATLLNTVGTFVFSGAFGGYTVQGC